jgi:hypothetical protein
MRATQKQSGFFNVLQSLDCFASLAKTLQQRRSSKRYSRHILIADEEFRVGERASEDEKCIAFFTASQ